MRLSVSVIARDEETALPVMLDSVKEIADEIVIVDTGSSDSTLTIAERYTDKVFIHPKAEEWRADSSLFRFDEARNFALAKCTGDWILSLDCDETVPPETVRELPSFLMAVPNHVDLVLVHILMCYDDGTPFQQFLGERLFRNGRGIIFEGGMHNTLSVPLGPMRVDAPQLMILHNRGVKDEVPRQVRSDQRLAMAKKIFLPRIKADRNDRRALFYLAGTYYDAGMIGAAIPLFERCLAVSDWPEERYQTAVLLARSYFTKGEITKAQRVMGAHLPDNTRRAEGEVILGRLALTTGDLSQAEWWFKSATLKPLPVDPLFVEQSAHSWEPHVMLFETYSRLGDVERAARHGEEAYRMGCPEAGRIVKYLKNHTRYQNKRILCLVDRGQMDFIAPLIETWRNEARQVEVRECVPDPLGEWDIIWCEWAGPECVTLTGRAFEATKPRIIVRVHGYEAHCGLLSQVDWRKVDDVIFVASYLRDMAIGQAPEIMQSCNTYVVSGGVETAKYSISPMKTGRRIAMACYGNDKKNFPMALQIMAALPEKYELHIATEWQDDRHEMYFRHMRREMGLEGRVTLYPWQADLNEFYRDKDYYLSCSIEESFHYALAEGMAAGLKPVVHDWLSARDFYADEWIFSTVDEAVSMITAKRNPGRYRNYAIEHLDIERNRRRVGRIIKRPSVAVCGEPKYPDAFEYKLARAFEQLGCRTDAPDAAMVIIMGHSPHVEPWMDGVKKILWAAEYIGNDPATRDRRDSLAAIIPQVDIVCAGHKKDISLYTKLGAKEVIYLSSSVATPPFRPLRCEKEFDVGFYGVLNARRQKILRTLGKKFKVGILDECYDHERVNQFINSCKVIVNIHFTEEPYISSRLAESLAAGAVVVSEPLPEKVVGVTCAEDLAAAIRNALKAKPSKRLRQTTIGEQAEKLLGLMEL